MTKKEVLNLINSIYNSIVDKEFTYIPTKTNVVVTRLSPVKNPDGRYHVIVSLSPFIEIIGKTGKWESIGLEEFRKDFILV